MYHNYGSKGKSGRGIPAQTMSIENQRCNSDSLSQWRHTELSKENLEHLKGEVMRFKPEEDKEVSKTRILMIGPVGAGKSSLYNTIDSIYRGRIAQHALSGCAGESLTTHYTTYEIKDQSGTNMAFCLCDTRGMEEINGLHPDDCKYLLDGNIKEHYKFSPDHPISRRDQCFVSSPSANDRVHCIVFVIDATALDVLPKDVEANIKTFQDLAKERGIPQTVVLTKIDKLCEDVKKDISFACKSPVVETYVKKAEELLGLPRNKVFPVKNYENETELDDRMSILALVALKKMLDFSEDSAKARLEKAKIEAERAQYRIINFLRNAWSQTPSRCTIS